MSATEKTVQAASNSLSLEHVQALVSGDMRLVDSAIRSSLGSEVALINQVSEYIIASGGKRMRPVIHLLSAGACGEVVERNVVVAAIIEFIHTATLLHDDVVDESDLRRGQETANAVWGNAASVLVGDFLYSRAFQLMVKVDSMRVMDILAQTTNTIAEGEVMQLLNMGNPDTNEAAYRDIICSKTACLFQSASELAAVLADKGPDWESALRDYGHHLGVAFQLTDDLLDYTGDVGELGKNLGDDLAEGKPTLPLIYLLENGQPADRTLIKRVLETGDRSALDEVVYAIRGSDALRYTEQAARRESEAAIDSLAAIPTSEYKDAMVTLAHYASSRTY